MSRTVAAEECTALGGAKQTLKDVAVNRRASHDYEVDPQNWRNGGLWVLNPSVAFGWNVGNYPADATRWHF